MRVGSIFLSFSIHLLMVILILIWPQPKQLEPVESNQLISVVIGDLGGDNLQSPVLGPESDLESLLASTQSAGQPDAEIVNQPINTNQQTPSEAPVIPEIPEATLPPPTPNTERREEELSEPASGEPTAPEPEPILEPVLVPEPVPEQDLTPTPEPTPEPEPTTAVLTQDPDPEPSPTTQTREQTSTPSPPQPTTNTSPPPQTSNSSSANQQPTSSGGSVADALAGLVDSPYRPIGGGGGQGSGSGGGGIYDPYAAQVYLAIQPNWNRSAASFSNEDLSVQIRILVNTDGQIRSCIVMLSSGNQAFDHSALDAVDRSRLPPPPNNPIPYVVTVNLYSRGGVGG